MKSLLLNIIKWIKQPDDIELNISFSKKVCLLFQTLLLDYFIAIAIFVIVYFIHEYVLRLESPLMELNINELLLIGVVVMPFFEELIFRFPLKYKRNYLFRCFNFLSKGWIRKKWTFIFKYFLYLMILLFGFLHLSNFSNIGILFYLLSPLIVGSQLIGGIFISYTRIKLGFVWAIIQHSLFNLTTFTFMIALLHNASIIDISNEGGTIQMKELVYMNSDESYLNIDKGEALIYQLEANDYSLHELLDYLGSEATKKIDNKWIDVYVEYKDGISKADLVQVLEEKLQ